MNQRKSKKLRKEAQAITKGLSLADYNTGSPPVYARQMGAFVKQVAGEPSILVKGCTRRVYRQMKKTTGEGVC